MPGRDLDLFVDIDGFQIHDPSSGYEVISIDNGGLTWVHAESTSPFVHGKLRTSSRKDEKVGIIAIRVLGDNSPGWANLDIYTGLLATLVEKFSGEGYTLTIKIHGKTMDIWKDCGPADYQAKDGGYNKFTFIHGKPISAQSANRPFQEYTFTVPYNPIPGEPVL